LRAKEEMKKRKRIERKVEVIEGGRFMVCRLIADGERVPGGERVLDTWGTQELANDLLVAIDILCTMKIRRASRALPEEKGAV